MNNPQPRRGCCLPILLSAAQAILVLFKLIGAVDWPWAAVVSPLLVFLGLALALWLIDVIWFRPVKRWRGRQ